MKLIKKNFISYYWEVDEKVYIIIQELFINFDFTIIVMLVLPVKVYNRLSEASLHTKNGYTVYSGA